MRFRRSTVLAITTALLLLILAPQLPAQSSGPEEYRVKAAFVYNFAKFVEWPAESFAGGGAPMVVTVLGTMPDAAAFETIRGKSVRNRKVEVRLAKRLENVGATHILFVCGSEKEHLARILDSCRGQSILTISDIEHFDQAGGMISFVTVEEKVRFLVHLGAARRSGLRISSQLLKLARNVIE